MNNTHSIYIIILNWNNVPDTVDCLDSLNKIDKENYQIILVNNDVEDFPVDIQRRFGRLTVINNRNNLGFCKGNNIGIQLALEKKADYILILNNDTIIEPGFLKPLIEYSSC